MAHMVCTCGQYITNNVMYPNQNILHVISSARIDEMVDKGKTNIGSIPLCENYEVWICPKCQRWHIMNEKNERVGVYVREEE